MNRKPRHPQVLKSDCPLGHGRASLRVPLWLAFCGFAITKPLIHRNKNPPELWAVRLGFFPVNFEIKADLCPSVYLERRVKGLELTWVFTAKRFPNAECLDQVFFQSGLNLAENHAKTACIGHPSDHVETSQLKENEVQYIAVAIIFYDSEFLHVV